MMLGKRIFKSSKLLQRAREHSDAGRYDAARGICMELLAADPKDLNALDLLGQLELRQGNAAAAVEHFDRRIRIKPGVAAAHDHLGEGLLGLGQLEQARACFRKAIELSSKCASAHNNVGISYALQGRYPEAAEWFTQAVSLEPNWALPHFNLGLALKERSQMAEAAGEFRSAWINDLRMSSAMHEYVDTVAEWSRLDRSHRDATLQQVDASLSFSIIFCSIDDAKYARTIELYERLFNGFPHELIPIRDARSLSEAYNRGVAASTGEIVLLSHDDIDILASDFAFRLQLYLKRFDVVGVMGATQMSGPSWNWSRHPYLRGWITHHADGESEWLPLIVDPRSVADHIVVLDGVLIAARREVFSRVEFDENLFDGFHLYDTDWSYRAAVSGYRIATAGDLMVVHASRGSYDDVWRKYAQRFCRKHLGDELLPPAPLDLAEASLSCEEEVRAFFARLKDLDREGGSPSVPNQRAGSD